MELKQRDMQAGGEMASSEDIKVTLLAELQMKQEMEASKIMHLLTDAVSLGVSISLSLDYAFLQILISMLDRKFRHKECPFFHLYSEICHFCKFPNTS